MRKLFSWVTLGISVLALGLSTACGDTNLPLTELDIPTIQQSVSVSRNDTTWTDLNENSIADIIQVLNNRVCYGRDACGPMPNSEPPLPPPDTMPGDTVVPPPPPPTGDLGAVVLSANALSRTSSTTISASATPGSLLLLWVSNTSGGNTQQPSVTGSLSWSPVQSLTANPSGGPRRITVFSAIAPSGSFSVTINSGSPGNLIWSLVEHQGVSQVVQVQTATYSGFELGGLVMLSSQPSGSITVGGFFCGCASNPQSGQGFTTLSSDNVGSSTTGSFYQFVEFQEGFDISVDASWASIAHWIAIALALS